LFDWFNKRYKSFGYAFKGIALLWTETHFKIHTLIFLGVLVVGLISKLNAMEWALILLASGMVFLSEGINSAVEKTLNRITTQFDVDIKNIKDISAGFTLISALFAVFIGILVFYSKIAYFFN